MNQKKPKSKKRKSKAKKISVCYNCGGVFKILRRVVISKKEVRYYCPKCFRKMIADDIIRKYYKEEKEDEEET
jgi:predicted RNA-binding Zn-ribbon protein involved in translation (DUF1610 family)